MENQSSLQPRVNPRALEVCRILSDEGYQAFIVGGCVRDLLLGQIPKDWDITTDATPTQVMKLFPKNIPTGLQHGTVTVVMGEGVENHFEVTTFRIEGAYTDGRRPEEVFFVMNVEDDLARRDLTINAMAFDPITQALIDPFGGMEDLSDGIIRAVGSPQARFQEDGLRIMRVCRFAARFGFKVHYQTFSGMSESIDNLRNVSKERITDELSKTLVAAHPASGLDLLELCGALKIACPYLCSQPTFLHFMKEQNKITGDLSTRLAFLYGNCTPVEKVQEELFALKFPNKEIKRVFFYGQLLDRFREFLKKRTIPAYKSFMAVVKNHAPDPWEYTFEQFKILMEAMNLEGREYLDKYNGETVFSKREMQINGDDLVFIGIRPGPQIKIILEVCYLEILRNPEHNTKSFLLDFAAGQ